MEKLKEAAERLGLSMSAKQADEFEKYLGLLLEWNEKINLTAIREKDDIILKHFIDSLTIIPHIPKSAERLVDIGTGAGIPGIPIKIMRPDLKIELVDSVGKKITFLMEVVKTLGFENTKAMHYRINDLAHRKDYREKFDVVTGRALAYFPTLLEYALPLLKIGGIFIAQKLKNEEEIIAGTRALEILGGEIAERHPVAYPGLEDREIIIVKKVSNSPDEFPRGENIPKKYSL